MPCPKPSMRPHNALAPLWVGRAVGFAHEELCSAELHGGRLQIFWMTKIEGDEAVVLHASGTSEHSDARWAQGVEDVGELTGAQTRGPLEHCLRDLRPILLRQLLPSTP